MRGIRVVIMGLLLVCPMAMQAGGIILTVTSTDDTGPGSLRQALSAADNGDVISFAPGLHGQIITLTTAELVVDKDITINGPGSDKLSVSRFSNTGFRIFHVMPGHVVTIRGLTATGGGLGFGDAGAGILNDHATLTLRECEIEGNGSAYVGGGIYNDGSNGSASLTIVSSTVSFNFSPGGGGIYNDGDEGNATLTIVNSAVSNNISTNGNPPADFGSAAGIANSSGIVTITNSTIKDNSASNDGGGILSAGELTISNSTVSGNRAGGFGTNNWPGRGGGISADGLVTISNSTISGNSAWGNDFKGPGYGGGIAATGVEINNCTISGNSATIGGGISTSGGVEIGNTILNNNSGANIHGAVTSQGYNISSDNGGGYLTGPGDQINTDPLLGPLQDNGGRTATHALLPGSPAIDTGDPTFTPPPFYDQRGPRFRRVFNGRIDVGSFEVQPEPPPFPTPRPRPMPAPRP